MRLWIDTDIGDNPDDAVALLCACAHPNVELVGVSTTGGRTEWRAELARQVVEVPVIPGESIDVLADTFGKAEPEAVLAIGPLTSVAALVAVGIAFPPITVMGGALFPVEHRGRVQTVEFNFARDPAAAAIVVARSDATIVPLDVTVTMRLDAQQVDRLVHADARLAPEVARWQAAFDDPLVLHDPLALLSCVGEPVVTSEHRMLEVDAHDGRLRVTERGCDHAVVVDVDAHAAIHRLLELLGA